MLETTTQFTWPPLFTVKKHQRARHVKLKASPQKGLEIVVPPKFNLKNIASVLEEHKTWIIKQLTKIGLQQATATLPTEVHFAAITETWQVSYIPSEDKKVQIIPRPHHKVVLLGNIDNITLCKRALIAWSKEYSKKHVLAQLEKISREINLPYKSGKIRNQTTRWGSCSSDKNISLSYKLLLLPPALTRHIIIHELCHTVHMNHSPRFWQLVASFDVEWKTHHRRLRKSHEIIPGWAL